MRPKRVFSLLTILLLCFAAPAPAADATFVPGEKLNFLLRWEFVPAGEATISVEPMEEIDGETVFHFVLTAKTNSFLDVFYKVRDRIDSYTDVSMERSVFYKQKQREGKTKRDITVSFDWENNLAQYTNKGKTNPSIDLLPGTFDPLGIFYYVRASLLEAGSTLERPVTDGKKCVIGIGKIIRRETITVPAGTYDTYLIEPNMQDVGGVFEKSEDDNIHIWVTADSRHIPVKIQSKVVVGRFLGELTEAYLPETE